MNTRRFGTMACVALLAVALTGCRDRSTDQDAQDKLCAELGELDASVTKLAGLEPTTASVARVREIRAEMEQRYREVEEAAKDVSAFSLDAIRQAYNNVLASTNGVNDQATLVAADPQIDRVAGEFSSARLEVHTTGRCA